MTVHKIKTSVVTTVTANIAHDTWLVTKSGAIDTLTVGINAGTDKAGREIIVEGHVYGVNYGIMFGQAGKGAGLIVVEKGGEVQAGDTAILSAGNGQEIVNRGEITGTEAIVSLGKDADFLNDGTINGSNTGIRFESGGGRFVNNGKMFGESGVYAQDSADNGRIIVINNGLMDTTKGAIDLQTDGGHLIKNTGTIKASVYGGDGKDRFINDGGTVTGNIDLADGNDTYIIDRSGIAAYETINNGTDTVKASADYTIGDHIERLVLTGKANIDGTGNSGDNTLQGNAGRNTLDGWGGNDMLKGRAGADIFVFSYHGGSDEILDFKTGEDRIDMRGWSGSGYENFADVKANATEMGNDLLLNNGGSDDLLIHDFSKADLHKADFIF